MLVTVPFSTHLAFQLDRDELTSSSYLESAQRGGGCGDSVLLVNGRPIGLEGEEGNKIRECLLRGVIPEQDLINHLVLQYYFRSNNASLNLERSVFIAFACPTCS